MCEGVKENIPFLREWIIYHLHLGFSKIYLYDNTGSIGRNGSNSSTNKYNFNFDEIIKLTDLQIDNELQDILTIFADNIIYIKCQPKNDEEKIVYGYCESIIDYTKKSHSNNNSIIYTAFIDIDEYIYSVNNLNLLNLITKQHFNNINKIIITQKKFTDRFCNNNNNNVVDIIDTIKNIDPHSLGGTKQIINNQSIDITQIVSMHNIGILYGKILNIDANILRFNHYNLNTKQLEWIKSAINKDKIEFSTEVNIHKDYINKTCGNKCNNIKYKVKS